MSMTCFIKDSQLPYKEKLLACGYKKLSQLPNKKEDKVWSDLVVDKVLTSPEMNELINHIFPKNNELQLSKEDSIDIIQSTSLSPPEFFDKYVRSRTPVLFNDRPKELEKVNDWNNSYLLKKCGAAKIKVEKRVDGGGYGKGNEEKTTFKKFLQTVQEGHTYLTTQDLEYDEEGRPLIISPPLSFLREDYPISPSLFSNLVLANMNMWFGHTLGTEYTSSGLHHDFHDNLYVLLRGEKKITLVSPTEASNLYTVGQISKVHPNGRINYTGQLQTRADGSDPSAERALQASQKLESIVQRINKDKVEEYDSEDDIEDALDKALEEVLEAELDGEGDYEGSSDDCSGSDLEENGSSEDSDGDALPILQDSEDSEGDWEGCDDLDESCDSEEGSCSANSHIEEADDSCIDSKNSYSKKRSSASSPTCKRPRREANSCTATHACVEQVSQELQRVESMLDAGLRNALQSSLKTAKNKRDNGKITSAGRKEAKQCQDEEEETSKAPVNFSRVDTSLPPDELEARFPLFKHALDRGAAVEVTLKAGQMLYIPAGWFHEVRSRALPAQQEEEKEWGGHLALNYWFHPPDGLSFDQPYTSDFWKRDFEHRSSI